MSSISKGFADEAGPFFVPLSLGHKKGGQSFGTGLRFRKTIA